ncbi:MAG TPA: ComF family protein [Candidatus Angelobacter sp.]|nr:ComF family protein [Candidatus Angelobacter sp.]
MAAAVLEALAPRRCAGCGLPAAGDVCEACVELSLTLAPPPSRALAFGACHAALPFEPPVRSIVHHAKYRGRRGAAAVLGALVVERLWPALTRGPSHQAPPGVVVVPVPLGPRRRRARGYNQAALLAAALARQAGAPVAAPGHALRLRDTAPQVGRRGEERRANVSGAFAWRGPPLHAATVWLVDDVVTTGATLAALATALQQAGASRIEGVAAAMVQPRHA